MGKRCLDLVCAYLASDGTCLMDKRELPDQCPARENLRNEMKDVWMTNLRYVKKNGNPSKRKDMKMVN
jgi:hypothetical protein